MAKRKKRREFKYPIVSAKAYDGDTVKATLDCGEGIYIKRSLRIVGIDAPELHRDGQTNAAAAVMGVANQWLDENMPKGLAFLSTERPKYAGRMVGQIFIEGYRKAEENDLGRFLLVRELVRTYDGGRRGPWEEVELKAIFLRATQQSNGAEE